MNMAKCILMGMLMLMPICGMSQQTDTIPSNTTLFVKGRKFVISEANKTLNIKVYGKTEKGDTIADDKVYEATYNDEQTTERRFLFSTPFSKWKEKNNASFEPHSAGIYIGYCELNDGFGIGNSNKVNLNLAHSWEIGLNLFNGYLGLTHNGHWGLTSSFGWAYRSFRLEGNNAFRVNGDNITTVQAGTADNVYTESRLRYNCWRLPLAIEWQNKIGKRLFVSAGIEPEWRFKVQSKACVNGNKATLDKGLNIYPFGANALLQAGYGSFGFYLRSSLFNLFKSNYGPKLYPCSFNVAWYW
jgi:hypothetical protein